MGVATWKRIGKVLHRLDTVDQDFASVFSHLESITERIELMSQQLDAITAEVKANKDVTASAVTLIQGLAAKIESLKDDPVALQQLADELKGQDDTLAAAIQANTPVQPVPPVPKPPEPPAPAPPAPAPTPPASPAPATPGQARKHR